MTMSHYFVSDVHLREDHPERDDRLRRFLRGLTPDDRLVIVGDLCDFWMGARSSARRLAWYPSLRALADFHDRGGSLEILPGNHDNWLCPFYQSALGAKLLEEPSDIRAGGLRVRLVHGHRLGARRLWKAAMESRAFFRGFGILPGHVARPLDRVLTWKNERGLLADEERHLAVYRDYAASCRDEADLVVIGHVHRPVDEAGDRPRLVVLGGWQHRSSYLRLDEAGATFHVLLDGESGGAEAGDGPADHPVRTLSPPRTLLDPSR
jgi:UDP-2,3-diacylglucosamine hydrolase